MGPMKDNTPSSETVDETLKAYSFAVQDLIANHKPFDDGVEAGRYRAEAKHSLRQAIEGMVERIIGEDLPPCWAHDSRDDAKARLEAWKDAAVVEAQRKRTKGSLTYKDNAEFGIKLLNRISSWRLLGINGWKREPSYEKFQKMYLKLGGYTHKEKGQS